MIDVLGLCKTCATRQGESQLSLSFPDGKYVAWKNMKTVNISGTMLPVFFNLSPWVWDNNGLLNKYYWDDFDVVDQGHSDEGLNVSQLLLCLGNTWTNCNKISIKIIASWSAQKVYGFENVGQGHHLQTSLYLSYYTTDVYKTFT